MGSAYVTPETLSGKVAVVSGSSSGIGAAIARDLSQRGCHLVINYPFHKEKQSAEKVLSSLPGTSRSIIVEADLSTVSGPRALAAAAASEFGKIDILVNNAGICGLSALDTPDDDEILQQWDAIMSVNGRGTLLFTREALKYMSPANSRIINICSSTSRNPDPDMSIYAGSKGMIESFTRCWARDLPRKYGCTVNAVAPGPVATEQMLGSRPEFLELLRKGFEKVPVEGRMAKPEEIAWTVGMMCEEGAGWLNGLYIPVTGGSTLC
ncbi:3-oxoacyl-reductase [Leptodontidium sp. 2 PMI_412]|nr:3-oxoacyl-reductase [Leptodontidium sp. 2 PMI_412]